MKKSTLVNGALAMVSIAVCAAIVEFSLRLAYPRFANYNLEMWRYCVQLKRYAPDPKLPFTHRPGASGSFYGVQFRTNALGLRDREIALEKTPSTKRIAVLGDSIVLGWGIGEDRTISRQLEAALRAGGVAAETINCGVGNYNTGMELELFRRTVLPLQPDAAVLVFFINDAEPVPVESGLVNAAMRRSLFLASMFDVYARLRPQWDRAFNWREYYAALYRPGTPGLEANRAALRELTRLCRERGVRLLIASYPDLHALKPYPFGDVTAYVERMARENETAFVDLLPAMQGFAPESLWVSAEDAHGNAVAAEAAGKAIAQALIADKLLSAQALAQPQALP